MAYTKLMVGICVYPDLNPEEGWLLQQIASWYRPEKFEMYRHPTQLAKDCGMSRASFYRVVKRLEKKNLLTHRIERNKHNWDINVCEILSQIETRNSQIETRNSHSETKLSQIETLEGYQRES